MISNKAKGLSGSSHVAHTKKIMCESTQRYHHSCLSAGLTIKKTGKMQDIGHVDFIVDGVEEYIGVTVISPYSEQIKVMIIEDMRKGLTIYDGKSGYVKPGESAKHIDIIYIIITRLEIAKFQSEIKKIDPNAFIVMNCVMDLQGGMVKKRHF